MKDYAFKQPTSPMATRVSKPPKVQIPDGTKKLLQHVKAQSVVVAQEIKSTINAPARVQQRLC